MLYHVQLCNSHGQGFSSPAASGKLASTVTQKEKRGSHQRDWSWLEFFNALQEVMGGPINNSTRNWLETVHSQAILQIQGLLTAMHSAESSMNGSRRMASYNCLQELIT